MPDPTTTERPNIVLIMVDDMGYSDIGCYGAEIETPNLDRLGEGGVRFTQMYNCARCCPTRASLLTGLYPHQAGVGHMVGNGGLPAYQGYLNDNCATIAETLRAAGYRTLMSGKWHAGGPYSPLEAVADWHPGAPGFPYPLSRGFERWFGTLAGAGNYYNPYTLMRDGAFVTPDPDEDFFYTEAISDYAVEMVNEYAAQPAPFFLYVAYTAPHWPLQAREEDIAKYRGKYQKGWDTLRTERHEKLKGSGVLSDRWEITRRDETAPPWEEVAERDWEDERMAVYAAQVDEMDQGVGQILAALKEQGVEDNTLVVFLSDNGGCAEFLAEEGGWAAERYGGPTLKGDETIRVGNAPDNTPGPENSFMSYDLPWANASNTPFRLYKHWVHEGGIATPLIAHWPEGVAEPGAICHAPAHLVDIVATIYDVARAKPLEELEGNAILPPEGESFLEALQGKPWQRQEEICWEHEGNRAVRQGRWKLVSQHPGKWELYDMEADRTETHDLVDVYPDKVRELAGIYDVWAAHCGVVDWDTYRPSRDV